MSLHLDGIEQRARELLAATELFDELGLARLASHSRCVARDALDLLDALESERSARQAMQAARNRCVLLVTSRRIASEQEVEAACAA